MRSTTRLRELLGRDDIIVAPGAFDGLSARLVQQAGFPAVYATGGGIARSMGMPDLGLLGMTEVVDRLVPIVDMFQGGKTPLIPLERLQELGYRVVIIPSDLQRAAIHAMQEVLAAIARDGHSAKLADRMASFAEREAIVGTKALLERGQQYATPCRSAKRNWS